MINRVFADRAYLDLCRTLRYKITIEDCEKSEFKNKSIDMIIEGCDNLYKKNVEEEYGDTHQKLCEKLFDIVNEADILDADHEFSYGQARKWVNMTMKYFVLMKNEGSNDRLLSIMHIPVDDYVKDVFKKSFPQDMEKEYDESWSKWNKKTYLSFLEKLRRLVKEKSEYDTCFDWEYYNWINMVSKSK